MKFYEIISPCCIAGKNVPAGTLIPENEISQTDAEIIVGVNLAREIVRYPVDTANAVATTVSSSTKKSRKK